jgi:hypothetical protein
VRTSIEAIAPAALNGGVEAYESPDYLREQRCRPDSATIGEWGRA